MQKQRIIYPEPLTDGSKIAVCSPAGRINPELVRDAVAVIESQGWNVQVMPHALGGCGTYSGTASERYEDLYEAFSDPSVRAILCSRGGYGAVHLIDRLARQALADDPKWLIGFSDISALHALMGSKGIASIHSSMCRHLALHGAADSDNATLFSILRGERPTYVFDSHTLNRAGTATGILRGGNMAVIADLIGTPFDMIDDGIILFVEDLAEPIYKIERILQQLRLRGILGRLNGLIVGQFTDYKPSLNYGDMESMIADMVSPYGFPVVFNAPIGHVDHNIPLIESAEVTLIVNPSGKSSLIFHG